MLSKFYPCQYPTPYNKISTGRMGFHDNVEHPDFALFKFRTNTTAVKAWEIGGPLMQYSPPKLYVVTIISINTKRYLNHCFGQCKPTIWRQREIYN
jgi:hypothetical protein